MSSTETELAALRVQIDRADDALLEALAARRKIVLALRALKLRQGLARIDPAREDAMKVRRAQRALELELPTTLVDEVFRQVLEDSRGVVLQDAEGRS